MPILIDPPVTLYSPPERIREWIEELKAMQREYASDTDALESIALSIADAERWLASSERIHGST